MAAPAHSRCEPVTSRGGGEAGPRRRRPAVDAGRSPAGAAVRRAGPRRRRLDLEEVYHGRHQSRASHARARARVTCHRREALNSARNRE